jgi:hypothetical protein
MVVRNERAGPSSSCSNASARDGEDGAFQERLDLRPNPSLPASGYGGTEIHRCHLQENGFGAAAIAVQPFTLSETTSLLIVGVREHASDPAVAPSA